MKILPCGLGMGRGGRRRGGERRGGREERGERGERRGGEGRGGERRGGREEKWEGGEGGWPLTLVQVQPCPGGQVLDPGVGLKDDGVSLLNHRGQGEHRLQVLARGSVPHRLPLLQHHLHISHTSHITHITHGTYHTQHTSQLSQHKKQLYIHCTV